MRTLIPQRSKSDWFRLAWVIAINGFFAVGTTFNLWKEYAGIGLPRSGFANVSRLGLAAVFVLAFGIVVETLHVRGAAVVNVGVYVAAVLGTIVSVAQSSRSEPLALLFGVLCAAISLINLLLYFGARPRLLGT